MDTSDVTAAGFLGGLIMTVIVVSVAFTVFFVWLFWRIFTRTGMNGALGLLCLIPYVGWLVCIVILAFSRWPIEDGATPHADSGFGPPAGNLPPPQAPGTSVMPT